MRDPPGLVPGVKKLYKGQMILYSGKNVGIPHDIHYSWTGWPSDALFPAEVPGPSLFSDLSAAFRSDGLELESHTWSPERIQMTCAAVPDVAPVRVAQRMKGRLDHALRKAGVATRFSRKVAVRAIGHNRTPTVEAYVRDQLEHVELADPRYRERLASVAINNPGIDLSEPAGGSHGRYWYNLHLVFVVTGRYRIGNPEFLERLRARILEVPVAQGCALKRAAIMPDHLHVALRGNPGMSPLEIGAGLQSATAEVARCRLWDDAFYAGTFGDYDTGAVRGCKGGVRRS